jgi:exonuclease SbcC
MRGYIKHLNGVDWEKKLKKAGTEYSEIIDEIKAKTIQCEKHTKRLETLKDERAVIEEQVRAASQRDIDITVSTAALSEARKGLSSAQNDIAALSTQISRTKQLIQDLEDKMVAWEVVIPEAQQKIDFLNHLSEQIETKAAEIKKIKREQTSLQSKIDMLHDHEYDPDCRFCSDNEFVKQAEEARVKIVEVNKKITNQEMILKTLEQDYDPGEIVYSEALVQDFEVQTGYLKSLRQELVTSQLQYENLEGKISLFEHRIPKHIDDINYYNSNIEAYENLSSLNRDLMAITKTVDNKQKACDRCQKQLLELMSEKGSTKRLIEEAREGIKKVKEAERDYIAYDLFVQATHPNGISYEVIKSMLSIINSEIASVLSSIVDFEVMIDNDGSSLEIYLKHPRFDPRPLSMGSGAEKTIASMAIRLALISISSLPRPDFFILDEPATALDAEHMEGFVRLLQMIKSHFKTVLLITHLESLKDVVDKTIDIDKVDGYAQVKL